MNHLATRRFWQLFDALPAPVQKQARKSFELLKQDERHPSLHLKQIRGTELWSVRANHAYRAVGRPVEDGIQWFWIGGHAEYERLLKG